MTALDRVLARGNRGVGSDYPSSKITCADGFTLSVIAGGGTYCTPRPSLLPGESDGLCSNVGSDYPGPYTEVEVGFPSARPEPWGQWQEWAEDTAEPTDTVYGYVPVEAVRALIALHGGEK